LKMLGHEVMAVDLLDRSEISVYRQHQIPFHVCNIEAEPLPFESDSFDALSCCQALEHFTYSHLRPVVEMKRVLRVGGMIEVDVPNAVAFRSRSRMLRGKHITWDYKECYLYEQCVVYKGRSGWSGRVRWSRSTR
jgi:ubiquinone/menaquinone biosynthesis C-methylase UbiE